MKIYFYPPPPEIETINLYPNLVPHTFYYANLVKHLQQFATLSPDEADFFFIPVNLIKFQFHKEFQDPGSYIEKLPFLGKKPHILFAPGDFGQRKKSPYESSAPGRAYPNIYAWLDHRFSLIAFESTKDLLGQDIATLPYVLKDERLPKQKAVKRDLLFSFVGAISYPDLSKDHIRGECFKQFAEELRKEKGCFIGTPKQAIRKFGKKKGNHIYLFERSVFSICPAGYGRWTFRLLEAIKYGAIPVILSDGYKLPFSDEIPWEKISLRLPEKDLKHIPALLRNMPESHTALFQENLKKYAHLLDADSVHSLISRFFDTVLSL